MFDPQSTQSVKTVVYLRKRSHNWLLLRLCTKVNKYLSPQLNTTVGKLIYPSDFQSMDQNPKKGGVEKHQKWVAQRRSKPEL